MNLLKIKLFDIMKLKTALRFKPLFFWIAVGLLIEAPVQAQEMLKLSVQDAIAYGLKNSAEYQNAQLDVAIAAAKVKEVTAIGLPQANANFQASHNFIVQKVIVPPGPINPSPQPVAIAFQPNYSGQAGLTISQLLFNGSYLVGLQASRTYKQLSEKNANITEQNVIKNVKKAYFGVLVNKERVKTLDANIARTEAMLREMQALNNAGFVEKIDLDRLNVVVNNLKIEKEKVDQLIILSENILKFQIGAPLNAKIELTDKLEGQLSQAQSQVMSQFDVKQRAEYGLLKTNHKAQELTLKNIRAGYLPTLSLFLNRGALAGNNTFSDFATYNKSWFGFGTYGINMSIPIWDSFSKRHQATQAKLNIQKTENQLRNLENGLNLEVSNTETMLKNSIKSLSTQEANRSLAKEVTQVVAKKYAAGVGSNLDVITAESSLKEAEVNYFGAIYDLLIARVDFDAATGQLKK